MAQDPKAKEASYLVIDGDQAYDKYNGFCSIDFIAALEKAGGYRKWWQSTFNDSTKSDSFLSDSSLTFGATFGGLMKERMKFPLQYSYDYDAMLRLVRGEKLFVGGTLSSREYVFTLYIKNSVKDSSDVASNLLKKFKLIGDKSNVSLMKRRNSYTPQPNETNDDDNKGSVDDNESVESKYVHKVCNRHSDATDEFIKEKGLQDMKSRIKDYTVSLCFGIPKWDKLSDKDQTDVIVAFVTDDVFKYQATYLKKSTFDGKTANEKKAAFDAFYKWPKDATKIFGSESKIPQKKKE